MAYEPIYAISNKYKVTFGVQFHILALKALVKNHETNFFKTKIIAYHKSNGCAYHISMIK